VLLGFGTLGLFPVHGELLHEGEEGQRPPPVRNLGPEDRPSVDEGPVEHHGHERDRPEAGEHEGEVSGERRVEGSRAEGRIAEKATQPLIGGAKALRGAGDGTSEPSDGKRAGMDHRGAQADEIGLLVSVPGQTEAVDKGAEGANMSMEHGLLLSLCQVHDAPWEKPVLHADPSCNHADPRPPPNKPILLSLGEHRPKVTTPEYHRMLSNIDANGPIPIHTIHDTGLTLQTAKMITPRVLMLYGIGSYVFGQFNDSWELGLGVNYYPFKQRNMRINLQGLFVDKCPTQSQFGYYVGGMTGPILSLATDLTF
jgi:hypothetical protein